MIETIFVCSVVTSVLTACIFIYTLSAYGDSKHTAKKIIKMSNEITTLRKQLSQERALRIKAEANEAYYADKYDKFYAETVDYFKPF